MDELGWHELDFLCVTGDAYVDHPSFGTAIIARLLESMGARVGVIPQPDWRSTRDIGEMGRPRLGVMVAAGNLDSMLANYSTRGHRRRRDAYSPNGEPGRRPDRATITYCNRIRELWGDIPLIIGGIEASLRRLAHYDYWSDSVRRSMLVDSRADLLVYGMAERQTMEIARRLADGEAIGGMCGIAGTCWKTHDPTVPQGAIELPSYNDVCSDRAAYARAFKCAYEEQNWCSGRPVVQDQGAWRVVCEPPAAPLSTRELDSIYDLPYTREAHPRYAGVEIPATLEVKFSITAHRGCFGECGFCAISSHQGRVIQRRSDASVVAEAERIARSPGFKGYIHDVGGPSANFHTPSCDECAERGPCKGRSCLFPRPCPKLKADHSSYIKLLRVVRSVKGIKKVFVRSGLRYDYMLHAGDGRSFLAELCEHHVSGQLKIAPEHISPRVLDCMRKATSATTKKFIDLFRSTNDRLGKRQFLVPYFMSGHPGCGLREAIELAEFIRDAGIRPEQVQEFTPTPGSVSTCMWYTGIDPFTGEEVYVPRDDGERAMQRALLQYWMPENAKLVAAALEKAGRTDLIGSNARCLVRADSRRAKGHRAR